MNNMCKYALIFVTGLAAGGGIGALFFKKKYEKKADAEIESMREYYEKKSNYDSLVTSEELEQMVNTPAEDYIKPISEEKVTLDAAVRPNSSEKAEAEKVDYTKYYRSDPAEEEHPEDDETIEEDEYDSNYYEGLDTTKEMQKPKNIKLIKAEEFGMKPGFETIGLYYYTEDGAIVTEDDEEIESLDEVRSMIGDALTKYNFKTSDEMTIYVRNWNYACDYEIMKVHGSFDGSYS